MTSRRAIDFYNSADFQRCGREDLPEEIGTVKRWYGELPPALGDHAALELGCGKGPLSRLSPHYIGLDLSLAAIAAAAPRYRGVTGDMEQLPIRAGSIGFIFSWAAIEHVPSPEQVLVEIARALAVGGIAVLNPAWHCRPWAAEGLEFRSYAELTPGQRLRKAAIPLRNSLLWRGPGEFIKRARREFSLRSGSPLDFDYERLTPNLDHYAGTDSDAFTSMDPHAMIGWFLSRGWRILSHPTMKNRLLARHEPVVVQKMTGT